MNIVIVESPNKIKKIGSILGSGFKVMASMGHIRDLPGNKMAVDLDGGYTPEYKITKHKVVSDLKKSCANAKCVYIATDRDREGEGIAMHLIAVLKLSYPKYRRMTFNEITPRAVKQALVDADANGRLDRNMADAYQARRIVDRVVGYTLSPFLWKHFPRSTTGGKALSAGRVQSVTTRLVIDRETKIAKHKPEEKYVIKGEFQVDEEDEDYHHQKFQASLAQVPSEHKQALEVLEFCKTAEFSVNETTTKIVWHSPPAAYKTSVFQQDAGKRFGLAPKQSMGIAQKLYEKGVITYHRTDITRLSGYFIGQAKEYIENRYGVDYLSEKTKKFTGEGKEESKTKTKKTKSAKPGGTNVQAAHEAIRPTDVNKPILVGDFSELEKKVYRMIWVRAVASLMAREKCRRYVANIELDNTEEYWFLATYLKTLFKGFKILTNDGESDDEDPNTVVEELEEDDDLAYVKIESKQSFTEPAKRYTESALVKELENKGIGRPSTYANIIDTIQARKYVIKKSDSPIKKPCVHDTLENGGITSKTVQTTFGDRKKRLFATNLGVKVTEFLVGNIDSLMDYDFTKSLEGDLDKIADGMMAWQGVVGNVHTTMSDQMEAVPDRPPPTDEEKAERKQKRSDRTIGVFEGKKMEFFVGQYGPFIKHNEQCYSLPKDQDLEDASQVSSEMAIAAIKAKRNRNVGIVSHACTLDDKKGSLNVLKGQWGYYLKFVPNKGKPTKKDNYFLPRDIKEDLEAVSALTLEDCLAAVENTRNYRNSGGKKKSKK